MSDTEKKRLAPAAAILAVLLALALPVLGISPAPAEAHAAQGAAAQKTAKAKNVTSKKSRKSLKKAKVSVKTKTVDLTYSGKAVKPKVTVTYKGKKLKKGRDYKLSYADNVDAGIAKVRVTGKSKYKGSKTSTFRIVPFHAVRGSSGGQKLASEMTMKVLSPPELQMGETVEARFLITYNGMTLQQGRDFVVEHGTPFPDYGSMDLSKRTLNEWLMSADCPYMVSTCINFKGNYMGGINRDYKMRHVGSSNALQAARAA